MVGIAGPPLENTGCSEGTVSSLTDHVRLNNEVLAGSSLERYLRMLISQGQLAQERALQVEVGQVQVIRPGRSALSRVVDEKFLLRATTASQSGVVFTATGLSTG